MNKGNFPLFSAWLKQFTSAVFLQSFHAVFLMFTMIMLSQLQHPPAATPLSSIQTNGIVSIVAIASAMALLKFEKLLKKLLGIDEGPLGHTSAAGAKMFMGAKSAIGLGQTAVGGFKKSRDANRNLADIQSKKAKKQDAYNRLFDQDAYNKQHPNRQIPPLSQQAQQMYNNGLNGSQGGQSDGQSGGQSQNTGNNSRNSDFQRMLEQERRQDELDDLEKDEMKASKAKKAAGIDKYLNVAGTMASISVGMGAADELSEMLMVANVLNKPVDLMTDKYSNTVAGKEVYKEAKEKYTNENNRIIAANAVEGAVQQPLKYVDDSGNRNEEARASKFLEKSVVDGIKSGMRDYVSNVNRLTPSQPVKLSVEKIITRYDNYESKREARRQESRDIGNT